MSTENIISIVIPEEDKQTTTEALTTVQTTLSPYFVPLTAEQRKTLPKMSDGTLPFVSKVMDYAMSDPQFVPPFLNVAEMKKDVDAVNSLVPIMRTIDQLQANLSDTAMIAGSEAYVAALSYYNSVKQAAKMNVPGAKTIFEDLSKRFVKKGSGASGSQATIPVTQAPASASAPQT